MAPRSSPRASGGGLRTVAGQAALLAVAMTFANVMSYLLTVTAAHRLGPVGYGELAPLLGLLVVASVAPLALQVVTTRRWAQGARPTEQRAVARSAVVTSVAVGGVLALLAAPLAAFLHLTSTGTVLLVAAMAAPLTWVGYPQGRSLGHEHFGRVSAVVAAVAAAKVGGGLVGLALSPTVTTVLAGATVGAFAAAAAAWWITRRDQPATGGPDSDPGAPVAPELVHVGHALLALLVLVNADLVLARHFLAPAAAGLFAAGAIVSKIAYWMPQFVSVVALPRLVDVRRRERARRAALAVTAAAGTLLTVGVAVLAEPVVQVVAGPAYLAVAPSLWIFAAEGTFFALAQVLLYARLAQADRRAVVAVWAAVAALVGGVALAHQTPAQVAAVGATVGLLLVAVGLLVDRRPDADQSSVPGHGPG